MRKWVSYAYNNIEEVITVFFFGIMCVSVFLQVLFRYFITLNFISTSPILYAEELARYSYVWITFIGLSLSTKNRENITMSFFSEKMPDGIKYTIFIIVELLSLSMLFYLFIWSIFYANFNKVMISPALEFSMVIVLISVPIGFALTIIRTIGALREDINILKNSGGDS